MRHLGKIIAVSLILIAGNWVHVSTTPGEQARIVSITDGDTVRLEDQNGLELRVRLACIDAPESGAKYGSTATSRLAQLIPEGSIVRFKDLGRGDTAGGQHSYSADSIN